MAVLIRRFGVAPAPLPEILLPHRDDEFIAALGPARELVPSMPTTRPRIDGPLTIEPAGADAVRIITRNGKRTLTGDTARLLISAGLPWENDEARAEREHREAREAERRQDEAQALASLRGEAARAQALADPTLPSGRF